MYSSRYTRKNLLEVEAALVPVPQAMAAILAGPGVKGPPTFLGGGSPIRL